MSEPLVIDKWLADVLDDTTLATKAPGGVHSDVAPPEADEPYVVFSMQDATDVKTLGSDRVLTDATYLVKAVGRGSSYAALEDAADRIDALLDQGAAVTTAGSIVWCTRERPIRYSETQDGIDYRHLGALYRVQVREE